ncbi:MAG: hypothetical protein RLZZ505_458 [Verrucomicrobiota bacterium]
MRIILGHTIALHLLFGAKAVLLAQAQLDFWDRAPIRYSDTVATDRLAKLAAGLESGAIHFEGSGALARLDFVLKTLDVPPESQVLVFSKTSLQNPLIEPGNPRALFFSENAYVGYVPGGAIEVIAQDPVIGPVFYVVEAGAKGELRIERDTNQCMTCHATSRTESVPGMMIRSVFADEGGHPLLHLGTTDVTHSTPLEQRWGGWHVTGRSALPHLGNRQFTEDSDLSPQAADKDDLKSVLDVAKYPRPTSDIVSLLVLEHQCQIHNLLNAATLNYRRARHFSETINPDTDPDEGSAGGVADSWAKTITECLFFKNEADLDEGVDGDPAFQKAFAARYPTTKDGKSLADFRLYGHIFKHRCSYMVYSDAFDDLPSPVKKRVLAKMRAALAGEDSDVDWLRSSERKKITAILEETLPEWKEG